MWRSNRNRATKTALSGAISISGHNEIPHASKAYPRLGHVLGYVQKIDFFEHILVICSFGGHMRSQVV
jgi:hypothetical protein